MKKDKVLSQKLNILTTNNESSIISDVNNKKNHNNSYISKINSVQGSDYEQMSGATYNDENSYARQSPVLSSIIEISFHKLLEFFFHDLQKDNSRSNKKKVLKFYGDDEQDGYQNVLKNSSYYKEIKWLSQDVQKRLTNEMEELRLKIGVNSISSNMNEEAYNELLKRSKKRIEDLLTNFTGDSDVPTMYVNDLWGPSFRNNVNTAFLTTQKSSDKDPKVKGIGTDVEGVYKEALENFEKVSDQWIKEESANQQMKGAMLHQWAKRKEKKTVESASDLLGLNDISNDNLQSSRKESDHHIDSPTKKITNVTTTSFGKSPFGGNIMEFLQPVFLKAITASLGTRLGLVFNKEKTDISNEECLTSGRNQEYENSTSRSPKNKENVSNNSKPVSGKNKKAVIVGSPTSVQTNQFCYEVADLNTPDERFGSKKKLPSIDNKYNLNRKDFVDQKLNSDTRNINEGSIFTKRNRIHINPTEKNNRSILVNIDGTPICEINKPQRNAVFSGTKINAIPINEYKRGNTPDKLHQAIEELEKKNKKSNRLQGNSNNFFSVEILKSSANIGSQKNIDLNRQLEGCNAFKNTEISGIPNQEQSIHSDRYRETSAQENSCIESSAPVKILQQGDVQDLAMKINYLLGYPGKKNSDSRKSDRSTSIKKSKRSGEAIKKKSKFLEDAVDEHNRKAEITEYRAFLEDPNRKQLIQQMKKYQKRLRTEEASTVLPGSYISSAKGDKHSKLSNDYKRILSSVSSLPKVRNVNLAKEYNQKISAKFKNQKNWSQIVQNQNGEIITPNVRQRNYLRKRDNAPIGGFLTDRIKETKNSESTLDNLYEMNNYSKEKYSKYSASEIDENLYERSLLSINENAPTNLSDYVNKLIQNCDEVISQNKGGFKLQKYGPNLQELEKKDAENLKNRRIKNINVKYLANYMQKKRETNCFADD